MTVDPATALTLSEGLFTAGELLRTDQLQPAPPEPDEPSRPHAKDDGR
jgi:hypothetical protein